MTWDRWLRITGLGLVFSSALVTALALLPIDELMLPSWESDIKDWRTFLLSPSATKQRSDIAVVLISEKTLKRYPYRSPIDRGLQAALIRDLELAGVKAIGIDIIYDRPTWPQKDRILKEALRGAGVPIIMAGIDDRAGKIEKWSLAYHDQFLREVGLPVGHIYFGAPGDDLAIGDSVIRHAMADGEQTGQAERPILPVGGTRSAGASNDHGSHKITAKSFARRLAELDGSRPALKNTRIAWLRPPKDETSQTIATFSVPAHDPVELDAGTKLKDLPRVLPEPWYGALKGKVVIVGGNLYDTDQHLTPLSVLDRTEVPGAMIHAQIFTQIRDGRNIGELGQKGKLAVVGLISFIAFLLSWRLELWRNELLIATLGAVSIVGIGALAFWWAQFIIPSSIFSAWILGGTLGYMSRKLVPHDTKA